MPDRLARVVPLVALGVARALVVLLALQNRALRVQAEKLCERATEPYVGLVVPSFRAATLGGDTVTIGQAAAGELRVLFVFTTSGAEAPGAVPAWSAMLEKLDASSAGKLEVYGISLDPEPETRRYVADQDLPFPVLCFPERKLARL
ncbi:MAG: redoxin domain-containing protein [Gemmatimonadota bacterium]|nr:MAG: redoxin domain-containing protein [Gemmatimonadota bacterium]